MQMQMLLFAVKFWVFISFSIGAIGLVMSVPDFSSENTEVSFSMFFFF